MVTKKTTANIKTAPPTPTGHYVYLYRDRSGEPLYVGYGAQAGRANAHRSGNSHNAGLHETLSRSAGVSVEIVGPFGSEQTAKMVETTLISALRTRHNVHPGMKQWRFRPFGVPLEFVDRRDTVLTHQKLKAMARTIGGLLLVYVNARDFDDGRKGYDLASPPSDEQIVTRVDRWWQLARHAKNWKSGSDEGPRYLLGLSGPPRARFVVASCEIADWRQWNPGTASGRNGRICVPVISKSELDAQDLRGVKVEESPLLRFGSFSSQQFILLERSGARLGGASPRTTAKVDAE